MAKTKNRACKGKARYTRKEAVEEVKRRHANPRFGGKYASYKCANCGHWHVGHTGGRRGKIKR